MNRSVFRLVWPILVLVGFPLVADEPLPSLGALFPPGGTRGTTVEVEAIGAKIAWPPHVWTSASTLRVRALEKEGKLSVEIDPLAPPGVHWVRLFGPAGASPIRPFLVGDLPEIVEADDLGASPADAAVASMSSVVIDGRLAGREDADAIAFDLARGETLVAQVVANEDLASPMDAVLEVLSPAGFAVAWCDDFQALDPAIIYTAPEGGRYTVRIFAFAAEANASIRLASGDDYIYRLTATTGPWAHASWPLAVPVAAPSRVQLLGANLGESLENFAWRPPPEGAGAVFPLLDVSKAQGRWAPLVVHHPALPAPVEIELFPGDVRTESGDSSPAEPLVLSLPSSFTGRFDAEGDVDAVAFELAHGETVRARVLADAFGFPTDPVLRLIDTKSGAVIREVDDGGRGQRDCELVHKADSAVELRIEVRDRYGASSPWHLYRLDLEHPTPDFRLELAADQVVVPAGGTTELSVAVIREDGFDRPIEVRASDLPEGLACEPAVSQPQGDTAKAIVLKIAARAGSTLPEPGPFRVIGSVSARSAAEPAFERIATASLAPLDAVTRIVWCTVPKSAE